MSEAGALHDLRPGDRVRVSGSVWVIQSFVPLDPGKAVYEAFLRDCKVEDRNPK
jgi:hypothetical protein